MFLRAAGQEVTNLFKVHNVVQIHLGLKCYCFLTSVDLVAVHGKR